MSYHTPVLLKESVDGLNVTFGKKYVDATLGGGGHTQEILLRGGKVLGIDQDPDAINYVNKNFESQIRKSELKIALGNFADIGSIAAANGFGKVSGVLFDLGVSSYQIDESKRGFSFLKEEKLDMRMNKNNPESAFEFVNKRSKNELEEVFLKYGEENRAASVAEAIVNARKEAPITTSKELAEIVKSVVINAGEIHPATRVFQAIRIAVNDEIESLKIGLADAFEILEKNGRISVISFHSLEDRIVKLYFLKLASSANARLITKKPIVATIGESEKNRRSRSAKLRIIEKI